MAKMALSGICGLSCGCIKPHTRRAEARQNCRPTPIPALHREKAKVSFRNVMAAKLRMQRERYCALYVNITLGLLVYASDLKSIWFTNIRCGINVCWFMRTRGENFFLLCYEKKSLSESFPNNRSLLKSLLNATEVFFHSLAQLWSRS